MSPDPQNFVTTGRLPDISPGYAEQRARLPSPFNGQKRHGRGLHILAEPSHSLWGKCVYPRGSEWVRAEAQCVMNTMKSLTIDDGATCT